jgi:hypothetical protein
VDGLKTGWLEEAGYHIVLTGREMNGAGTRSRSASSTTGSRTFTMCSSSVRETG